MKILNFIYYTTTILLLIFCILYIPIMRGILDYHEGKPNSYIDENGEGWITWMPFYVNIIMQQISLIIVVPSIIYRIVYRIIAKKNNCLIITTNYIIDRVGYFILLLFLFILTLISHLQ